MRKWSSVLLGALVLVLLAVVCFVTRPDRRLQPRGQPHDISATSLPGVSVPRAKNGVSSDGGMEKLVDSGDSNARVNPLEFALVALPAGFVLLDGGTVPPLDLHAPSRVRFGVVLVKYRGAQGARGVSRTKRQALERAWEFVKVAEEDFSQAVKQGDDGSADSLGWISRGILEPAPEYVVFSTPKGQVAGPIDTPRGYWVVKILGIKK